MNTWGRRVATVILFIVVGLLLGWRFMTLEPPRKDEVVPIENAPKLDEKSGC